MIKLQWTELPHFPRVSIHDDECRESGGTWEAPRGRGRAVYLLTAPRPREIGIDAGVSMIAKSFSPEMGRRVELFAIMKDGRDAGLGGSGGGCACLCGSGTEALLAALPGEGQSRFVASMARRRGRPALPGLRSAPFPAG